MVQLSAEGRRRGEALNLPQPRHDPRGLCGNGYFDSLKPTRVDSLGR